MKTLNTNKSKLLNSFDFPKLLKYVAVPLLVGLIAALLTRNSMTAFNTFDKPPLSPPAWLFPVVWTVLYTLMGVSAYLIVSASASPMDKAKALAVYTYQLAVNFLWSIFFFNFQWYLFSFIWIILLWILIILMIRHFFGISRLAAYLNIPYLLWVTFAAYLNFWIWILNK